MLASSFFDPMLGIDIHWEMVPMPAPVPTPIPNPFVGIVRDFSGLAAGLALSNAIGAVMGGSPKGPVLYWGVIPATNTGTNGEHVTGHILIPPGTAWAPVPKTPTKKVRPTDKPKIPKPVGPDNDAIIVFGSKTVTVLGSNAVRLGDIALSCSEPLRLPSTVVMAVPKGRPILIGGPMSLDIMAAVMASLRTRFIGDTLQAGISHLPIGNRGRAVLSWIACTLTGHPVDVATGKMMTRALDADLPGPLPLKIERFYQSNFASRRGLLGCGWSVSFDQALWEERGKVVFLTEDGREVEFDTFAFPNHRLRIGEEVWHPIDRLTLRYEGESRWHITSHDGVRREFAPVSGRAGGRALIQRTVSRDGNHEIVYTYDQQGRIEAVRDSGGRVIRIEHDDHDRVVTLKLPHPSENGWYEHRRYEYDGEGDLIKVTDSMGQSWSFEYVTHLMVRETDRTGLNFFFEYDSLGEDAWCTRTWGDGGIYDHVIKYDRRNRKTFVENSLGAVTAYVFNALGQVVSITDALNNKMKFEYDAYTSSQVLEEGPLGTKIQRRFDQRGNLTELIAPNGASTRMVYNGFDRVRAIDPRGGHWSWRFDDRGQLVERIFPTGQLTRFGWQQGLLAWSQLSGHPTSFGYDDNNNIVSVRLPNGSGQDFVRDNLGRIVQVKNRRGGVTRIKYDLEGRIVETENPATATQHLAYDQEGNLIEVKDGVRHLKIVHARRRIVRREEGGAGSDFEWNTEGRLVAIVNERGEKYSIVLNPIGLAKEEVGFDGRKRVYLRDAAGRVVKVLFPSGRQSENEYDAGGRLVKVKHSDGTFARYEYDPGGLIVVAENESSRVEIDYDAGRRVMSERVNGREVRSSYGANGDRAEMTTSLGTRVVVHRGTVGEPLALFLGAAEDSVHSRTPAIQFDFDLLGMERARHYNNGIDIEWDRDVAGRTMTRQTFRGAPSTPILVGSGEASLRQEMSAQKYSWRGDDQISAIVDSASGTRVFDHDLRGRLVRERRSDRVIERLMDAAGNVDRTAQGDDWHYAGGNRLERAQGIRYSYDEDGNQTLKIQPDGRIWKYHWNGHGALSAIERPDGSRVKFEYDAFSRRTAKTTISIDGAIERQATFIWDGHVVVHELDSKQGLTTWHWKPDSFAPVAKEKAGHRWMIATDHLGVPREMYDHLGTLVWKMELDILGKPSFQAGSREDCPWRWPGQYEDEEHGDFYNRCRYYGSDRASFLSPDPAGLPAGLNLYQYVSDPLTWVDLLGLTGTYIFEWPTGETYIGKGPLSRAQASEAIRAREIASSTSAISHAAHTDFGSDKMGLMVEAELMRRWQFGQNPNLLNAINSPGEKLLQNASATEVAAVKAHADALEQDLKASKGKC